MPEFSVDLEDGAVEVTHHDGGLIRSHTWHVKGGTVHVADDDTEFFAKHVCPLRPATAEEPAAEETPHKIKKAR